MTCINYTPYPTGLSKDQIAAELDAYIRDGRGRGLTEPIVWYEEVFDSAKAAEDFLKCAPHKQCAARYRKYPFCEWPEFKDVCSRLYEARRQQHNTFLKPNPQLIVDTDGTRRCPYCHSGFNTGEYVGNYCRVCRKDLRASALKDKEQELDEMIRTLEAEKELILKRFKDGLRDSADVYWLVRTEYREQWMDQKGF